MPVELMSKIEYASEKLGLSKQDVMREAMKLGLAHYERINWDIQGAVLDASAPKRNIVQMPEQQALEMVAEDSQKSEAPAQASVNYKDSGLLHIQATDTFQPKTREARTIPLTKEFTAWLRDEYGLPEPFMLAPKVKHGSYRYRYDFRKAFESLVASLCYDVTFHDLRRTFASLHVSRGTSIYKVAKWLGDTVEVVESTYGHLIPQDAQIDAAWE